MLTFTHNIYVLRSQQVHNKYTPLETRPSVHIHTQTQKLGLRMRNIERIDFLLDSNRTHTRKHVRTQQ